MSFKLTNVGEYAVTFDDKYGIFVAAKDPDGNMRMVGNTYQGKTVKPKEFVTLETDLTLDKEGVWALWASYCIKEGRTSKCGPEEWHSCRINVETIPTPTPTPTVTPSPTPVCPRGCECLTEETAKDLGYVYCNGEKILCGYDQYRKPTYCYEKPAIKPTPTPTPSPTLKPPLVFYTICPSECECLTGPEAESKFGGSMTSCSDQVCGYGWVGDLYFPKYCYRALSIGECIDTDEGKNYNVKGSAAGSEDVCSPFSDEILQEYYVVMENGKCIIKSEFHDCNALCKDGRCLSPTCDDWIQNQGELGIDCGGPCPAACVCPSGCKCSTPSDAIAKADKVFGGFVELCSKEACGHSEEWVGDLHPPKFCYKISIGECKDTDGGLNYSVKGSALGWEDACFSDTYLYEYYTVEVNGKCEVKSELHDCNAKCKDGRCLPPTCDDDIQNQRETVLIVEAPARHVMCALR